MTGIVVNRSSYGQLDSSPQAAVPIIDLEDKVVPESNNSSSSSIISSSINSINSINSTNNNSASMFGMKIFVLVTLCAQNSGVALLTRYSQGVLQEKYLTTSVVLASEVIKLVISGYLAVVDRSETVAVGSGIAKLIWLAKNSRKIVVLVALYSIANIMAYYALARVDASVYSVLMQLKTFSTAAFAIILLGRYISATKWRGLVLLVLGCVLVASPSFRKPTEEEISKKQVAATAAKTNGGVSSVDSTLQTTLGVSAILTMVTISGYSAVYFEMMLKTVGEEITIWERNFQLALYSIVLLLAITGYQMQNGTLSLSFFDGWTINTVLLAVVQACGGLLVAATLKYADAVLKTLATSASIVLTVILGWMLLGGQLDEIMIIGCTITIIAIFNYTLDKSPAPKTYDESHSRRPSDM